MEIKNQNINDQFPIVGIGASAGGLEALEKFFTNMPVDSGLAFVVVQHLSPDYKSMMVELLSKRTSIPVHFVKDGMAVQSNNIYIIPPRKNITIFHRKLHLTERGTEFLHLPIDIFLNSLAEDIGEKAVAVILSGTGSDGTRGVRAIKEAGGMVMVQDPQTAKFDGMPRSAIATNLADYILAPEEMPEKLMHYVKHPTQAHDNYTRENVLHQDSDNLSKIFSMLRSRSGVDFTYYKQTTMLRRIERRMNINQINTLNDYVRYLHQNANEVQTLYKELLIGVTRFFRDPEAYEVLEKEVIPVIFKNKNRNDEIRVWVAGCSTGEEAYSLAILFNEYMENNGVLADVKIFATDIDRDALDFASRGRYSESIAADIPQDRLHNYFVRRENSFEVLRRIREMVIFAQQDITKDPPFSKIDLISCRNVLIYLQPVLQRKVLSAFQFALKPGGFLFQGSSETVGEMEDAFKMIHSKWRIFQYRGGFQPNISETILPPGKYRSRQNLQNRDQQIVDFNPEEPRLVEKIYRAMIDSFMPPTLVTDENGRLLHAFGAVDEYLKVPSGGPFSNNVLKMVRGNLSIPLNTAVRRAIKENTDVVYKMVVVEKRDKKEYADLIVKPFVPMRTQRPLLFIQFRSVNTEQPNNDHEVTYDAAGTAEQRIADLEQELQYTKENLQATIEELETTNEELQATNEELLAANEELQSTNEELQSVNEELITVNAEHQRKIQELLDLNADMNNIFTSTNIGIIFLDWKLNIHKFTPAAQREISLLEKDIGRPLNHITHNLEGIDFAQLASKVLETLQPLEKEANSRTGSTYLVKVRPYYTLNNVVEGVIIILEDITDITKLKQHNQQLTGNLLHQQYRLAESLISAIPYPYLILNNKLAVSGANDAFYAFFATTPEETIDKLIFDLNTGQWNQPQLRSLLQDMIKRQASVERYMFTYNDSQLGSRQLVLNIRLLDQFDESFLGILITISEDDANS